MDSVVQPSAPRVRFAPSPTGLLHVGNARTALYNWLFAKHGNGTFVLRVEDTDVERSEEKHEAQLMEDLLWLGLGWGEGPLVGGPHAPYRQSERLPIYAEHTARLFASGDAYRCFCTPAELEAEREQALKSGRTPHRCRAIDPAEASSRAVNGASFAIRLRIPDAPLRFHDLVRGPVEFQPEAVPDPVLVRSGTESSPGMPVYNYVVTVDDALMQITHVIRGDDHISNTPRQVAIYQALGYPVPQFAHLSTILGSDRERLSKRHGATSVSSFRQMGILPEALVNYLALLGWGAEGGTRETFTAEELIHEFRLERVTASPAIFDWDKLHWLNRHYMKAASLDRLRDLAWTHFASSGLVPTREDGVSPELLAWIETVIALLLPSIDQLDQLPAKSAPVFVPTLATSWAEEENAQLLSTPIAQSVIQAFSTRLHANPAPVTPEQFKLWMNEIKTETGAKGKDLFHPIRIILTGAHSGPEFDKLLPIIERGSTLSAAVAVPSVHQRFALYAIHRAQPQTA